MACVSGGTYLAINSLRWAKISRSGRVSVSGLDSSRERHFIIGTERLQGSFDYVAVRFARGNCAQDDMLVEGLSLTTDHWQLLFYIPGNFIPASRRAKLGLPICLNIFFICAYWRRRLFTSCTVVPDPRAMRLRRLPLMTS